MWFYKFLHQCNYYDFRLLTSSSMPGNWIFVSDASEGCSETQKVKSLYYKHIRRTVPQNGIPIATCTSKHAVLMIVRQFFSWQWLKQQAKEWLAMVTTETQHSLFTLDVFPSFLSFLTPRDGRILYGSFFKLFYGLGQFFFSFSFPYYRISAAVAWNTRSYVKNIPSLWLEFHFLILKHTHLFHKLSLLNPGQYARNLQ